MLQNYGTGLGKEQGSSGNIGKGQIASFFPSPILVLSEAIHLLPSYTFL